MTALCATGSPTTYAWSGGNCNGLTTQSCAAVDTNVTRNYSVVISNAIGPGTPNPATKQVVWSASLPVKPSNCLITPSPASLPAGGGSVNLTAQCSGDAVDSWTWGGATYTTTSGNTASATISTSTTFTVSAQNAGGTANTQVTVAVGGGGGGGGAPISCSGYLNTVVVTMSWPDWRQSDYVQFGPLDAVVLKFTTGSSISKNDTSTGWFQANNAPEDGAAVKHDFTLSTVPCDFGAGLKQQSNAGSPLLRFVIGQPSSSIPNLQPNSTYYVNVRNSTVGGCASTGGACNLLPFALYKPSGL